ncbi:hypothetical protein F511_03352 [Dorcoceras hygrometricum]|uniref:Uncharacterized protein n=1 Tax=Dorcoceras hygrometricum TaxID=472368 RepID=A0A2Z7BM97_9LAMI|nr:hypothetical protein F511_03352 [Dorcoceras hygrometricum]
MASTPTRILPTDEEPPYPTSRFRPSGRRTASFSSSSTSNSWDSSFGSFTDEYPPFSPIPTPLNFNGVPFSWEKIPGISKHQVSKMDENSGSLLPLPPAGNSNSSTKKHHNEQEQKHHSSNRFKRDPFFAALVECSKDGDHDHDYTHLVHTGKGSSSKISRSLSNGFGCINNMCTSCKRTCAISESIVCLPKSRSHYNRLNRHSS